VTLSFDNSIQYKKEKQHLRVSDEGELLYYACLDYELFAGYTYTLLVFRMFSSLDSVVSFSEPNFGYRLLLPFTLYGFFVIYVGFTGNLFSHDTRVDETKCHLC
jgi:hypothetical protein